MPELSAIVLCYRAGESIMRVLGPLEAALQENDLDYELVLVANYWPGQTDSTPAIVKAYAQGRPRVVFVSVPKQGAMGWDMRKGFDAATGEIMIVIDGDSQNPVQDVVRLFKLMRETGADVGKGRRVAREDGLYRRIVSTGYNVAFRVLFFSKGLWDINGKPKGLTREAHQTMTLRSDDWFADAEIVLEADRLGLRVVEMPVVFYRNEERASFVRFAAIWEFVRHMLRYRLRGKP